MKPLLLAWVVWMSLMAGAGLSARAQAGSSSELDWPADPVLSQLLIQEIVAGPDGLLWLGTDDGVYRYDGYHTVPLNELRRRGRPLPAARCDALRLDARGQLWIGTRAGLFLFTPAGELRALALPAPAAPLANITLLVPDPFHLGRVWVGQEEAGVRVYDAAGRTAGPLLPLPGQPVRGLLALPDGGCWLTLRERRTLRFAADGRLLGTWHHPDFSIQPAWVHGRPLLLSARAAYEPVADGTLRERARWLAPGPEVLACLRTTDSTLTLLGTTHLTRLAIGPTGQLTPRFQLALPEPLPNRVQTVGATWWLWHQGYRACQRGQPAPSFITPVRAPAPAYSVRGMARLADGRLLLSAYQLGLLTQAADSPLAPLRPFGPRYDPEHVPMLDALLLEGADSALVSIEDRYFARLSTRTGQWRVVPAVGAPPLPGACALTRDPAGMVWGGARSGLYWFDDVARLFRPWQLPGAPTPPFRDAEINALAFAGPEQLWLATATGLLCVNPRTGQTTRYATDQPASRRLPADACLSLYIDAEKRVWVGTRTSGLVLVEPERPPRLVLTPARGLPHATVATIIPGPDGALWLGTYRGLVRYEPATGQLASYGAPQGLANPELNRFAALADADGSLLFGGVGGLYRAVPRRAPLVGLRPRLLLTHLAAWQGDTLAGRALLPELYPTDSELTISPTAPELELGFALTDYLAPERTRFYYRIRGWCHDRWQPLGNTPRLHLQAGLPAGDYQLEVRAETAGGQEARTRLRLPLRVRVEWWQRPIWWAVGSLLLAAAAAAATAYWQTRHLRPTAPVSRSQAA